MDEQIRTNGAWSGDLNVLATARVYLERRDGKYHPGIFVRSLDEALRAIVEYGLSAPRAFVTFRDEIILEVCEGHLEFPDDAKVIFDAYKARFPSWIAEPENLGKWVRSRCAKLINAATAYAATSGFDGSTPDDYDQPVNRLERELQSVAAKYGLNLFAFGFQGPGVVCAELEGFDPDVATDGSRIAHTVDGVMPIDRSDVSELIEQSLPAPAPTSDLPSNPPRNEGIDERHAIRSSSLRAVFRLILVKPVRSIVLAALFVSGAILIVGAEWEAILSRLFLIVLFSGMAAFAVVLYKALDALAWGPPNSNSYRHTGLLDDELDLLNWRNGRVPRYMDETDPASGPEWLGNRQHQYPIGNDGDCGKY